MGEKAGLEERHSILKGFLERVYAGLAEPARRVGINPDLFKGVDNQVANAVADQAKENSSLRC